VAAPSSLEKKGGMHHAMHSGDMRRQGGRHSTVIMQLHSEQKFQTHRPHIVSEYARRIPSRTCVRDVADCKNLLLKNTCPGSREHFITSARIMLSCVQWLLGWEKTFVPSLVRRRLGFGVAPGAL